MWIDVHYVITGVVVVDIAYNRNKLPFTELVTWLDCLDHCPVALPAVRTAASLVQLLAPASFSLPVLASSPV